MKKTISLLVYNQNTVLPRICNLFARRAVPILSLSCAVSTEPTVSRITLVVDSGNHLVEQMEKQLGALVEVIEVEVLDKDAMISRELLLLKLSATVKTRQDILSICQLTGATVVDITPSSLTVEASGDSEFLDTIVTMLRPYDIIELVRTGAVALQKGAQGISLHKGAKSTKKK